jgi:hypothetical protein
VQLLLEGNAPLSLVRRLMRPEPAKGMDHVFEP